MSQRAVKHTAKDDERVVPPRMREVPRESLSTRLGWLGLSQELMVALDAIPLDSVTARTAGSLRVAEPTLSIAEEADAFEQGVAEENTAPVE